MRRMSEQQDETIAEDERGRRGQEVWKCNYAWGCGNKNKRWSCLWGGKKQPCDCGEKTFVQLQFSSSLYCMSVGDILPGLKCHSWSSEDDTSATRTVSTVTGNSRSRVGKAMTAATHLVTCPETRWWPQAYLSQRKKRNLDLNLL